MSMPVYIHIYIYILCMYVVLRHQAFNILAEIYSQTSKLLHELQPPESPAHRGLQSFIKHPGMMRGMENSFALHASSTRTRKQICRAPRRYASRKSKQVKEHDRFWLESFELPEAVAGANLTTSLCLPTVAAGALPVALMHGFAV